MRRALLVTTSACSFVPGTFQGDAPAAIDSPEEIDSPAAPACLETVWCMRQKITIGPDVTAGPHDGFRLLLKLDSDPALAAAARPDGFDIRFTRDDGYNEIPYERRAYDSTTGALTAWVRVPSLAAGTTLYLYAGNSASGDRQQAAETWFGYAAVNHLDETTGSLADTTGNGNAATPINGALLGQPGKIGNAVAFDGTNDQVSQAKSVSLDATRGLSTISLWINWTMPVKTSTYQRVLTTSNRFVSSGDGYEWATQSQASGGGHYMYPWGGAEDYNLGAPPFVAGQWHYLAATLDFATKALVLYVDGAALTLTTENAPTAWTMLGTLGNWLWGCDAGLGGCFQGSLDELRVMPFVRNAGFLATEFRNQNDPTTFYTVGAAETLGP